MTDMSWGGPTTSMPGNMAKIMRKSMVDTLIGNVGDYTVLRTFIAAFVKRYEDQPDSRHVVIDLGGYGTTWTGNVSMSEIRALHRLLEKVS